MKFLYEYRTKDNAVHSGVVCAATRDDAYSALKAQGVKPSRLTEAPGFFNHLFGKGKRWIAIGVLCALCIAVLAAKVGADRRAARTLHDAQSTLHFLDSPTRRQVIGDAAIIEEGVRTGWAEVFSEPGDRFLASFAIPGETPAIRSTTVESIETCLGESAECRVRSAGDDGRARRTPARASLRDSASPRGIPATAAPGTRHKAQSIETRQITAIVNGMKDELRTFLSKGGSIAQYGRLLVQRQEAEIGYYNRAKNEVDTLVKSGAPSKEIERTWNDVNARLRAMGIKLVPMPE